MESATKQFKKRNAILSRLQQTTLHPSAEMLHKCCGPTTRIFPWQRYTGIFPGSGQRESSPAWPPSGARSGLMPTPTPMFISSVPAAMRSLTCIRFPCPGTPGRNVAAATSKAVSSPLPVFAAAARMHSIPGGESRPTILNNNFWRKVL